MKQSLLFNDLVDKKFPIEIGSGTYDTIWTNDELTVMIESALFHNLYDFEFYYNWTDYSEEYRTIFHTDFIEPLLSDIDNTLNKYFEFSHTLTDVLIFRRDIDCRLFIDNWFKYSKLISVELRADYYRYKKEYFDTIS